MFSPSFSLEPYINCPGIDTKVLIEHVKFVRSLTDTEPFKSNCKEVQPGPACATDEQIAGKLYSPGCQIAPSHWFGQTISRASTRRHSVYIQILSQKMA